MQNVNAIKLYCYSFLEMTRFLEMTYKINIQKSLKKILIN